MTDDPTATPSDPTPPEPAAAPASAPDAAPASGSVGPEAHEAWAQVMSAMGELGDAVSRWARAAANDPNAKQKLSELRSSINDIASKGEAVVGHVAESDAGKQFVQGAEQAGAAIGDAAQQFSTAAAPHVKSAFEGLAGIFGKAAERLDEVSRRHEEAAAQPQATPAPAAPDIPTSSPAPTDESTPEA